MKDIPIADVRNFVLVGHTGSGKTALTDAIACKLGINDRHGSTDDGTSISDWSDEEKNRKISIWAKPFDGVSKGGARKIRYVFVDTPGYMDFYGQVVAATAVADAALVVVDAASGVQVGTNRAWRRCETLALPRGIAVTGLDKENTNFDTTLSALQEVWGARCIPVVIPVPGAKAVADVLAASVPDAVKDTAAKYREKLIEAAAETNDQLIEKYLGGETLSPEEISAGLRGAVLAAKLIPIFAVYPKQEVGVVELLDGIARLFPSPADRLVKDESGQPVDPAPNAPFCGHVWRALNDPFVGQLLFVRVYGGTLQADSEIFNITKNQKERIGAIYFSNGKKQDSIPEAHAGDIVALAKLKYTGINDSLCAAGKSINKFTPIVFPNPTAAYAVAPKTQGDEDKLGTGLNRIAEEDPTIRVERNTETKELILYGMGDVHLDVTLSRMKARSNVDVVLGTPKVAYKETVTALGEGHYKHKKQSGGRGQYGEVYLKVEPLRSGEQEWFVDALVGTAVPRNFVPAIQKGVLEGMARGSVAGYPVINTKVTIYDGSSHEVDSSEISFKIAAARAFTDGMSKARPVLLEPIMKVKVMVPDQYMGDITGDLNHKRGRILGIGTEDGMQVITAEVPQAEMFRYSSELRSMTGGRGTFEMEFARYDIVPSNIAQRVIAEAQKHKQAAEEEK